MSRIPELGRFLFWSSLVVIAVTGTVRIAHAAITQPDRQLEVLFSAPAEGRSQLFYSEDAKWDASESQSIPSIEGINQISFQLLPTTTGLLRWDIGSQPGIYRIQSVAIYEDGRLVAPGLLASAATTSADVAGQSLTLDEGAVIVVDEEGTPRLMVDLEELGLARHPPLRLRVTLATIAITFLLAAALWQRKWIRPAAISIGFVAWMYGAFAYYVAKFAPRIPYWDDWRYLVDLDADGKLPLTVSRMFTPFNDTVYATGKLLDTLILNSTNFSFYTLQLFGVGLLGVFVTLMILLVRRLTGRVAPHLTNVATLTVAFALMGQSYWLQPAVAYHQFLPVLLGVAILLLLDRRRIRWTHTALVAVFALLAGFAYISGAFLILVMGLTYGATHYRSWLAGESDGTLAPGLALLTTGLVAVISQLMLVASSQGSVFSASSVADTAYPWTLDFWAFYLGVASRAIGKAGAPVSVAVASTLALLTLPIALTVLTHRRPDGEDSIKPENAFPLLFAAILAPFYVGIVSAGRGHTLGTGAFFPEVMALGSARFHFWWPAAVLPLLWVGWHRAIEPLKPLMSPVGTAAFTVVTLLLVVPASPAPWHYPTVFANRVVAFERTGACISSHVIANQFDFVCQHISSGNIGPSVAVAYDLGLSFVSEAGLPDRVEPTP